MPRARKDQISWQPGNYYHLYNRGARRLNIFREEENYLYVLARVKHYCDTLDLSMMAYCLMPNHYHFLVRQDGEQPAGLLPQRVFNSYTKAYNKRYEHSGTLFERRYQAIQVTDEAHLRHLCRYIHANPVKDGIVDGLDDWPFSNYPDWQGVRNGTLLDRTFITDHFSDDVSYREFVLDYLQSREQDDSHFWTRNERSSAKA